MGLETKSLKPLGRFDGVHPELGLDQIFFSPLGFCARINHPCIDPPPAGPTRLQYYRNTIAQYSTPLRAPVCMPYTMQYCAQQYSVKANPELGYR